jgi:hypothetical protein
MAIVFVVMTRGGSLHDLVMFILMIVAVVVGMVKNMDLNKRLMCANYEDSQREMMNGQQNLTIALVKVMMIMATTMVVMMTVTLV